MKKRRFFYFLPRIILIEFFVASFFAVFAIGVSLAQQIQNTPSAPTDQQVAQRKAILEQELAKLEQEIGVQSTLLQAKRKESVSLERDVGILNTKIKKSQLSIKARDIALSNLGDDIETKEEIVQTLLEKMDRENQSLGQLMRKTDEIDQSSFAEVLLAGKDISEFFLDIDSFASVSGAVKTSLEVIREAKAATEQEKLSLEEKQGEELKLRELQVLEKKKIEQNEKEKKQILAVTKGQEKEYQKVIAVKQKSAAEIRAALFQLSGAKAIPFGKALEYANFVGQKTGVRPAFLLAIITQETNLGENIGTCNRPGDPPNKKWTAIMPGPQDLLAKKSRRDDQSAFLRITSSLGYSPDAVPLSCPFGSGWGGAMGPSQFIPTTWESQKSKIAAALGKAIPDPWDPKDAFMASALYLSELGADKKTPAAEREAALRYYAGGNWKKSQNAFYGDEVMATAGKYETNISILQGVARQ